MQSYFKHQYNYKNKTSPLMPTIKEKTVEDNFSLMIRLRDIVTVISPTEAYCVCITCRRPVHWRYEADAGHCFTRGKPMTKYNEKNVNAQCHNCNRGRKGSKGQQGEQGLHILRLIDLYGKAEVDKLEALSKIRGQKKHSNLALYDMNEEFKRRIKELVAEKGVVLKL